MQKQNNNANIQHLKRMKKVLVNYQIPRAGLVELEKRYEVYYPSEMQIPREKLLTLIPEYDALLSIFNEPIDLEVFRAGKKLKVVSNYGVGYNNIDIQAANKHNVLVCNTPVSVCEPTAELAFGHLVATMRNISGCNTNMRSNPNFKWGVMENLGYGLMGKTLGIIGMGNIGKAVARRAKAFGMNIIYHNRNRMETATELQYEATYVPFEQLLRESDAVTLHTPLTQDTTQLIGAKELALMKPTAFLINTARGAIVDEQALVTALKSGLLAGAGLDVFEKEPSVHPELLQLPNVTLTAHLGSSTHQARIAVAVEAAQNIVHYFETGKPLNHVNPKF